MARRPRERRPGWTTRHLINHVGTFCFIHKPTVTRGLEARRQTGSDLEQAETMLLATWKTHSHMSTVLFLKKNKTGLIKKERGKRMAMCSQS